MPTSEQIPGAVRQGDPILAADETVMREAMRRLYSSTIAGGAVGTSGMQSRAPYMPLPIVPGRILEHNVNKKERHAWRRIVESTDNTVNFNGLMVASSEIMGGPNDEDSLYAVEMSGIREIPANAFNSIMIPIPGDGGPVFLFALQQFFEVYITRDDGGGDAALGDKDNPMTVTYTVKTWHDNDANRITLGTALTPLRRRAAAGKWSIAPNIGDPGIFGVGHLGRTGFDLYDANEVYVPQGC